ncbi:accessory gene regulator B family protein [Gudongella sp. SC589]|uniref:accessory gene regulator B family protein n=1 Tax=Gudongella sp. SC589 TaxID=3385990 RepID=UPI003904829D
MTSKKIADLMVQSEIISVEDKDLYEYGLHQSFILLANIFTTILVGWIFNMMIESIIFLLAFVPLRSYAGGYHAKTPLRCYVLSVVMISITLLLIRMPVRGLLSVVFITTTATGTILVFAPVEDINKPLKQTEKKEYKRRISFILATLLGLITLFWSIEHQISISIMSALVVGAVMVLLGKLTSISRQWDRQI